MGLRGVLRRGGLRCCLWGLCGALRRGGLRCCLWGLCGALRRVGCGGRVFERIEGRGAADVCG